MDKHAEKKRLVCYGVLALIVLMVWLIENTAGIFFAPNNLNLYLMVGVVSAIGMLEEPLTAALYGMSAGLLSDIFTPGQVGFNSIVLLLIGLFTSLLISNFMRSTILTNVMFSGAALLIYVFLYWLVMLVFKGVDGSAGALFTMFLPRAFLSLLFCPFLYIFIRRVRKFFI